MHAVPLSDSLFERAQLAAAASGLSLEHFVAEAIQVHLMDDAGELSSRFTPGVISALDRAASQADSGQMMTFGEYQERERSAREQWRRKHADSQFS